MESRVLALYDYHKVDLSEFAINFVSDEAVIEDELQRFANRKAVWKEGDTVNSGDTVTLSMQSETERYQRESITLAVRSGLFDPVLEQNLCGMHVGETKEVSATDGTVLVTIQKVVNRVVPELTDALIAEAGMDGIQTMSEYINTLIEQQKQEKLEEVSYEAEQKILHDIFEKSEYLITYRDWRHAVEMQINRYAAIAESDGMKLQEMTAEDFEGKIPVGSFFELVAMVQDSTWDYMREYLAGAYYAQKDGVDVSRETYEAQAEEYAAYWQTDLKTAEKINTYDEFVITQNKTCLFQRIQAYIRQEVLKEG